MTLTFQDINKRRLEQTQSAFGGETKRPDQIKTSLGSFKFYERLKDVPDGKTAIYIGSSGIGNKRFLEIATQNRKGSAAKTLNLRVGKEIKFL